MEERPGPQMSPDGQWWWDGEQWIPAWLEDRRRQARPVPRWPVVLGVALAAALIAIVVYEVVSSGSW